MLVRALSIFADYTGFTASVLVVVFVLVLILLKVK